MSTDTVTAIGDLLRGKPAPGAAPERRLAWHAQKAELLSRIADDAAEHPGLVDPGEARQVAEAAWRQFEDLTAELAPTPAGKDNR